MNLSGFCTSTLRTLRKRTSLWMRFSFPCLKMYVVRIFFSPQVVLNLNVFCLIFVSFLCLISRNYRKRKFFNDILVPSLKKYCTRISSNLIQLKFM